jgi:cell division protein FtsB
MDFRVKLPAKLRLLARPEDGVPALLARAPEAEAWVEGKLEKWRPWLSLLYGARRRIATVAVAIFAVLLFLHVMLGANGMVVYRQKKAQFEQLQKENQALQQENDRYTEQIKGLKGDPEVMEREAREKLHYAKPGEVIYVSPPSPPAPPTAANRSASKGNPR